MVRSQRRLDQSDRSHFQRPFATTKFIKKYSLGIFFAMAVAHWHFESFSHLVRIVGLDVDDANKHHRFGQLQKTIASRIKRLGCFDKRIRSFCMIQCFARRLHSGQRNEIQDRLLPKAKFNFDFVTSRTFWNFIFSWNLIFKNGTRSFKHHCKLERMGT